MSLAHAGLSLYCFGVSILTASLFIGFNLQSLTVSWLLFLNYSLFSFTKIKVSLPSNWPGCCKCIIECKTATATKMGTQIKIIIEIMLIRLFAKLNPCFLMVFYLLAEQSRKRLSDISKSMSYLYIKCPVSQPS